MDDSNVTPAMDGGGRQRPLTPMTMGLVKHILKSGEGVFGLGEQVAAGMSVHSLVQKKTRLLHDEERMLAQFTSKQTLTDEESALQSLAKQRVKDISRQLRVLATWSRKHSSQQLQLPAEISFSRPSSAYRSVVSHVSAPPQGQPADFLRLQTPGIFNSVVGGLGAMALEHSAQVQHSWPAVASVVMTPWGAALSPLPPLAHAGELQQEGVVQEGQPLGRQRTVSDGDQNARSKDAETILLQQRLLERQQQLVDQLISLQQNTQHVAQSHGQQRLHPQPHQPLQPLKEEQPASELVLERVQQLEQHSRTLQRGPHPNNVSEKSTSHSPVLQTRARPCVLMPALQPSKQRPLHRRATATKA